jgi:hypothetical protein
MGELTHQSAREPRDVERFTHLRAAVHEMRCRECRVTWRSWLARLLGVGGTAPKVRHRDG